ncbi:hypothetical protein FOMPIDRAFT_1025085 [Fomitopsis schrenkii]|uniref:Uncharacterized protein n=1 Tax=Fomitopsis schrenkii TaxID=2126942 RepID=S8E1N6_FOMSC|nr:hypothetical protein FOMPIDRAFT_1025085 [Fomitopsis schrenkii]
MHTGGEAAYAGAFRGQVPRVYPTAPIRVRLPLLCPPMALAAQQPKLSRTRVSRSSDIAPEKTHTATCMCAYLDP